MYGQFIRNLDSKNRIMLPTKIIEFLGNKFILTIGMDQVVELRPLAEFEKLTNELNNQSQFDKNARILKRFWLGNSAEIELDSQNRFIIPKQFLEKAAIQKEVLFIGVGNLIELWGAEAYSKYEQAVDQDKITEAASKLAERAKQNG